MEEIVLQTQWGWQIACYLFLGGLAAGTLVVSGLLRLKYQEKMDQVAAWGSWAATACLIVGTLLLVTEVSMPLRALMLWQSFSNFGSWMAIGAWLLVVGTLVAIVFALSQTKPVVARLAWLARAGKGLAVAAIVLGACIAAYTGVLLSVLAAHPLWNTALLPVLFVVSAFDTGVALVVVLMAFQKKGDEQAFSEAKGLLEKTTVVLAAFEIIVLAMLLFSVSGGSEIGARSVALLASGPLSVPFWLLFVVVGLLAPLAASAFMVMRGKREPVCGPADAMTESEPLPTEESRGTDVPEAPSAGSATAVAKPADREAWLPLVGAACCLVGGCALRFLILLAGIPVWA